MAGCRNVASAESGSLGLHTFLAMSQRAFFFCKHCLVRQGLMMPKYHRFQAQICFDKRLCRKKEVARLWVKFTFALKWLLERRVRIFLLSQYFLDDRSKFFIYLQILGSHDRQACFSLNKHCQPFIVKLWVCSFFNSLPMLSARYINDMKTEFFQL